MKKARTLSLSGRFLLVADIEFEDIGARVVPAGIKFHLGRRRFAEVEIGNDELFPVPNGLGEELAEGIDDAAAAAANDLGQTVDLLTAVQLIAG